MDIRFSNVKNLLEQLNSQNIEIKNLTWIEPIGIALLKLYKEVNKGKTVEVSGDVSCISYVNTLLHSSNNSNT